MIYIITKTTDDYNIDEYNKHKPCNEAFLLSLDCVKTTVNREISKDNIFIKENIKFDIWCINVDSLDDLNKLNQKYGELICGTASVTTGIGDVYIDINYDEDIQCYHRYIEIYDGYRE